MLMHLKNTCSADSFILCRGTRLILRCLSAWLRRIATGISSSKICTKGNSRRKKLATRRKPRVKPSWHPCHLLSMSQERSALLVLQLHFILKEESQAYGNCASPNYATSPQDDSDSHLKGQNRWVGNTTSSIRAARSCIFCLETTIDTKKELQGLN